MSASSPTHALRLANEHAGDIRPLITDVLMPELNGKEVADRIAAVKPGLKCLYMSGYTANVLAGCWLSKASWMKGCSSSIGTFSLRDPAVKVGEIPDSVSLQP